MSSRQKQKSVMKENYTQNNVGLHVSKKERILYHKQHNSGNNNNKNNYSNNSDLTVQEESGSKTLIRTTSIFPVCVSQITHCPFHRTASTTTLNRNTSLICTSAIQKNKARVRRQYNVRVNSRGISNNNLSSFIMGTMMILLLLLSFNSNMISNCEATLTCNVNLFSLAIIMMSSASTTAILSVNAAQLDGSSSSTTTTTSIPLLDGSNLALEPDDMCNIEDLEQANDSQLYAILHELIHTTFFRNFLVNLDRKCPLQSWNNNSTKSTKEKQQQQQEDQQKQQVETTTETTKHSTPNLFSSSQSDKAGDADDEFCPGGGEDLDPDAPPLCSISEGTLDGDPFSLFGAGSSPTSTTEASGTSSSNSFESKALYTIAQNGYQSQSQQDTFSWKFVTDKVRRLALNREGEGKSSSSSPLQFFDDDDDDDKNIDDESAPAPSSLACDDDDDGKNRLPDTFWNDMCRHLQATTPDDYIVSHGGSASKVINLLENPERNTGYNGTHIWRAIYEENCIAGVDGDDSHMCFEERVLYRLLSGLHTSTTISIAKNYFAPSKKKNRINWESNPSYFMSKFENNPDHIRNLHFSYAVLLRALHKASSFLYEYSSNIKNIHTGNTVDDETARVLLRRLLDSSILKSCSKAFSAFDESLMFQESAISLSSSTTTAGSKFPTEDEKPVRNVVSLQQNFKGVFHNISSIIDCVQCQQCKLHGKMSMLGYGTALKILFMDNPVLERNEIVAFINTIAKFSESIRDIRHLTQLHWSWTYQHAITTGLPPDFTQEVPSLPKVSAEPKLAPTETSSPSQVNSQVISLDVVDTTIGLISSLGRDNLITFDREHELVQMVLRREPELLILAKHYVHDRNKFLQFSSSLGSGFSHDNALPDAIVVGSGLAGMTASLNILDRGGRVVLLEKEHLLGGNSNKASSGINACCPTNTSSPTDSMELFVNDTINSAGSSARPDLVSVLVSNSASAIEWLRTRVGVDLSLTSQLGGHSDQRTHRPSNGMVGAEIIYGVQKAIKAYEKLGQVTIVIDAKVTKMLVDEDEKGSRRVVGVEYVKTNDPDGNKSELRARNVILATGGFAADRSKGSYLDQYRPELLKMPATAGSFSTGDGVNLATALGAGVVDMDKVQIHPTGWVDPADPDNTSKTLAAELLRGVGGILLNEKGKRFCNEVGTRAYVTGKMLSHSKAFAQTGIWNIEETIPKFSLILSSSAAAGGTKKHVDLYTRKGLMKRLEGVAELAKWMGLPKYAVVESLKAYQKEASKGKDEFGKTVFLNVPATDLDKEIFYAGTVTPVLHYCMGGITIDAEGNVLNGETGEIIPGLHAAGEVTGGVHGANRLAGNSLLECTVFGMIVGRKIPIAAKPQLSTETRIDSSNMSSKTSVKDRVITKAELANHNTSQDCWVAIHGVVYDLTQFADEHPAGSESIHELAGQDGTAAFEAVHNKDMLNDFDEETMGILAH